MRRRSARLVSMGHYDCAGQPVISYKETLYRVFIRRRIRPNSPITTETIIITNSDSDGISISITNSTINKNNNKSRVCIMSGPKMFGYLILISLYFGFLSSTFLDSRLSESPCTSMFEDPDFTVGFEELVKQTKELQDKLRRIRMELNQLIEDSLPNFALDSLGARVLSHLSSETYQGDSHLVPGRCWAFSGRHGHLVIALSHPATLSYVTLGHISKSQSPTGSITSAPKEFSVYGMETLNDEGMLLGTFFYDQDGEQLQTFRLLEHEICVYKFVKLHVQSNWDHPEYSCLYSFRVHGMLA
ncbi:SUN domain-containing protein 2-like [Scomber scombrus]|uniref:SUN domain-containing protein 2-like n=1 Tax=Scomber scombrus TaxID=13677 RepID=A0AAV1NN48_SCOSC